MTPQILDNPGMLRMGWVVIHFLWQGTLIALALKGALILVGQRSSRMRYALALACLFLMAAMPVLLFTKPVVRNSYFPPVYQTADLQTATATGLSSAPAPTHSNSDFRVDVFRFLSRLTPWISAFWLVGVALLLMKTAGGVLQVRILKKKATTETDRTESFRGLAAWARVARVPILESGLVSIPTVAGWFRPVVLLPQGVSEKISGPMLDALVAHEFAHIRRHDSLMNLLQTLIENLLFFHPATWWVSRCVRAEREACCDDDAVTACRDRLAYVRALSQAEQFRSSIPVIALSSSPLFERIRRLTEMRIAKTNHISAFCMTILAASSIIATAAGSVLLATIPGTSTVTQAENRNSKSGSEQGASTDISRHKYSLLCGIVSGGTRQANVAGKPAAPPAKFEAQWTCMLIDTSTPGTPKRVAGELQPSRLISKVAPIYPEPAIRHHVGIRVILHVNLDPEGRVTGAQAVRSQTVPPDTDSSGRWVGGVPAGVIRSVHEAAVNAVRQWKYSPTLLNGKAIPVTTTVVMTFTFNKDGSPKVIAPLS